MSRIKRTHGHDRREVVFIIMLNDMVKDVIIGEWSDPEDEAFAKAWMATLKEKHKERMQENGCPFDEWEGSWRIYKFDGVRRRV